MFELKDMPYLNEANNAITALITNQFKNKAKYFIDNQKKIERVISYLSDEESKQQFSREIGRIVTAQIVGNAASVDIYGNMSHAQYSKCMELAESPEYPKLKLFDVNENIISTTVAPTFVCEQYKYHDMVSPQDDDIVIDAGALCGDTAFWFLQKNVQKVYSFEPIERQYKLMFENLLKYIEEGKVVPIKKGLSDKNETLSFVDNRSSSKISKDGNILVECVSIDEFCKENHVAPTFIKMDIEGAELSALHGAKNTIKQHTPKLAICLYHKKEDMLEIPLYLKSICPEYKFFCKANHPYLEFVLYATV